MNLIQPTTKRVTRIGISVGRVPALNASALRFLVLHMNCLQTTFEFEFLPSAPEFLCPFLPGEYEFFPSSPQDDFCLMLSGKAPVDGDKIRAEAPLFLHNYREFLTEEMTVFRIKEPLPDHIVLLTFAHLHNNYYTLRLRGLSILAMGNWERYMAPPSILEFILTLILREAVAVVSPSLRGSVHIGTKGCLLDFTTWLNEVRFKVLQGFVCNYCRRMLDHDGFPGLADELVRVLRKDWLGKSSDPTSPAGITSNLGYDLFLTKGLESTVWESFGAWLQKDGVPEFLKLVGTIIGGIILAIILLWLGIKQ
jgi:hypothetical protein